MQIGRKLKKEIRGIVNSGKEIPDEVLQEIKGKNPDLSDEEILEYITREFPKVSEEDKQFKELEINFNVNEKHVEKAISTLKGEFKDPTTLLDLISTEIAKQTKVITLRLNDTASNKK